MLPVGLRLNAVTVDRASRRMLSTFASVAGSALGNNRRMRLRVARGSGSMRSSGKRLR